MIEGIIGADRVRGGRQLMGGDGRRAEEEQGRRLCHGGVVTGE